jgi:hypothetical protein
VFLNANKLRCFVHMQFRMKVDKQCKIVCRKEKLDEKSAALFKDRIGNDYRVNM